MPRDASPNQGALGDGGGALTGAAGGPLLPDGSAPAITGAEEISADEHWVAQREIFDVLYSTPRAVPFVHKPCAERTQPAQYLRRGPDGRTVCCPTCGAEVAPELVEQVGILGQTARA